MYEHGYSSQVLHGCAPLPSRLPGAPKSFDLLISLETLLFLGGRMLLHSTACQWPQNLADVAGYMPTPRVMGQTGSFNAVVRCKIACRNSFLAPVFDLARRCWWDSEPSMLAA